MPPSCPASAALPAPPSRPLFTPPSQPRPRPCASSGAIAAARELAATLRGATSGDANLTLLLPRGASAGATSAAAPTASFGGRSFGRRSCSAPLGTASAGAACATAPAAALLAWRRPSLWPPPPPRVTSRGFFCSAPLGAASFRDAGVASTAAPAAVFLGRGPLGRRPRRALLLLWRGILAEPAWPALFPLLTGVGHTPAISSGDLLPFTQGCVRDLPTTRARTRVASSLALPLADQSAP